MTGLNGLLDQLSREKVMSTTLGQVGRFIRGNGLQKSDLTDSGVPAIHYGQIHTYYGISTSASKSFTSPVMAAKLRRARTGDLVIATTSEDDASVGKATAWLGEGEVAVSGDAYIYHHSLDPLYAAYFFDSKAFQDQKGRYVTGTKVRRISGDSLARLRIAVPPLEVQREIARILDQFTQLKNELRAELAARRRQYEYYQRELLSSSVGSAEWMTLGDIGRVVMCKRVFKTETTSSGDVPFYKIGTFGGNPDAFISQSLYDDYSSRYPFPKRGDVLISAAGTIGRSITYDGKPAYFQDSNIVWVENDESVVSNAFLAHWYRVVDWSTDGSMIRRLYNENIRRTKIAVPSCDDQKQIVRYLNEFDSLVNDPNIGLPAELAARHKQYEYYRDKLLTFEEPPA